MPLQKIIGEATIWGSLLMMGWLGLPLLLLCFSLQNLPLKTKAGFYLQVLFILVLVDIFCGTGYFILFAACCTAEYAFSEFWRYTHKEA